mmetsp:Transcript_15937/g.44535  ORF Transcript_15937/g.44535 Transcript_15937/m.44535 type:complete len:81 (+) Transcript_15937:746-988(+)
MMQLSSTSMQLWWQRSPVDIDLSNAPRLGQMSDLLLIFCCFFGRQLRGFRLKQGIASLLNATATVFIFRALLKHAQSACT